MNGMCAESGRLIAGLMGVLESNNVRPTDDPRIGQVAESLSHGAVSIIRVAFGKTLAAQDMELAVAMSDIVAVHAMAFFALGYEMGRGTKSDKPSPN